MMKIRDPLENASNAYLKSIFFYDGRRVDLDADYNSANGLHINLLIVMKMDRSGALTHITRTRLNRTINADGTTRKLLETYLSYNTGGIQNVTFGPQMIENSSKKHGAGREDFYVPWCIAEQIVKGCDIECNTLCTETLGDEW